MIARVAVVLSVLLACSGCARLIASQEAKERAAEAAYLVPHMRCVDAEPEHPLDAGVEERRAAHARIDACREQARREWRVTRVDGGAP